MGFEFEGGEPVTNVIDAATFICLLYLREAQEHTGEIALRVAINKKYPFTF